MRSDKYGYVEIDYAMRTSGCIYPAIDDPMRGRGWGSERVNRGHEWPQKHRRKHYPKSMGVNKQPSLFTPRSNSTRFYELHCSQNQLKLLPQFVH